MSQIVEYSVTDAELSNLAEKYAVVPDAATDEGYQAIKECLKETTPLRTAVERRRKELKKDALEYGRKVDSEAKRITKALVDIETPYREAKQAIDDEAARIEQEKREAEEKRIQCLVDRIAFINQQTEGLLNASPAMIQERIDWLAEHASLDTFEEYTEQAEAANNNTLNALNEALRVAKDIETQQAEQARIAEDQAKKQAELDKQAEEVKRQQAEVERQKREEEEKKIAAERAEAAKVKAEKDRLEREAKEAAEAKAKEEAAEAERLRVEAAKPDREKLRGYAEALLKLECPVVEDEECNEILGDTVALVMEASNNITNRLSKNKAA